MSRLAAGIWVAAYLRRLQMEGIPVYVTARGDDRAGSVWVKLATLDGQAELWTRQFDLAADRPVWTCAEAGPEAMIDARIRRERGRDPDLWVLEVEDTAGRHLLDDPGFA